MAHELPDDFARLVAEVRQGKTPRVVVRDLVGWFGFDRRGAKVNGYIRSVMQQEGVVCAPALEAAFPEGELVFSSVVPMIVQAPPVAIPRPLPHPIAVFDAILEAQADVAKRVGTRLDAIERIVAYLVFADLAAVRAAGDGRYSPAVTELLKDVLPASGAAGPPLSFGTWVDYARKLGPFVDQSAVPVRSAAQAFAGVLGGRIANEIVPLRNKLKHGSNLPEAWFRDTEPSLEAVDHDLRRALEPLLECELFCVRETRPGEREAYLYDLRVLHGGGSFFRRRSLETSVKLTQGWAYLELPGVGAAPLRLAPGIACVEDQANEQVRLFFSRTLALAEGDRLVLQAVLGVDDLKERVPR